MSSLPILSVVMPVRNEERHLEAVVCQLLDQTLAADQYEILVVDGLSTDGTRALVRQLQENAPHLHLLDNPALLASSARNIGARQARGRFILFVDGHCHIPSREMLSQALAAFQRGEKCISRPQPLVPETFGGFSEAVSLARCSALGHYTGSKIYSSQDRHCNPLTAGCGYERDLFWQLGGMDEGFDAAEDLEFNFRVHRQGVQAFHSHNFTVEYRPRDSFPALFRQLYRYGYGRGRMTRKHPRTFSFLSMMLGLLGLLLVLLPLAGVFWPGVRDEALVVLGSYASLTALAAVWAARRHGPLMILRTWLAFPAIHFGAGVGYLSGLLQGPDWRQGTAHQKTGGES